MQIHKERERARKRINPAQEQRNRCKQEKTANCPKCLKLHLHYSESNFNTGVDIILASEAPFAGLSV